MLYLQIVSKIGVFEVCLGHRIVVGMMIVSNLWSADCVCGGELVQGAGS